MNCTNCNSLVQPDHTGTLVDSTGGDVCDLDQPHEVAQTGITLGMEDGTIVQATCPPEQWAITFVALAQGQAPSTYRAETLLPADYHERA